MENKVTLFFIFLSLLISSCKKEEEQNPNTHGDSKMTYYDLQGTVFDSLTGMPDSGAIVYLNAINDFPDTANSAGHYSFRIASMTGPPHGDIDVLAITNNKAGKLTFPGSSLVSGGSITLPSLYIVPKGYIKTHIIDTTQTSLVSINYRFNNSTLPYNSNSFQIVETPGNYADSTIIIPAFANADGWLNWYYTRNSITHNVDSSIYIRPGDTTFIDFFY